MSLRLPANLPPGEGLRAVLLSLARQAGKDIAQMGDDPGRRIHSLRTGMKKIRSLVRLAGGGVAKPVRRALCERVRLLKDGMAGSRDEGVIFKTVEAHLGRDSVERLGLDCPHMGSNTAAPEGMKFAAAELVALIEAVDLEKTTAKKLRRRWAHTGRKARKAAKMAAKSGEAHDFHAWRKRMKDLWYQSAALAGFLEKAGKAQKSAKRLSDDLGIEHDLTVVLENVRGLTAADRETLIAKRRGIRKAAQARAAKMLDW